MKITPGENCAELLIASLPPTLPLQTPTLLRFSSLEPLASCRLSWDACRHSEGQFSLKVKKSEILGWEALWAKNVRKESQTS